METIDVPALGRLIFRVVEGHDENFPVHPPIRPGAQWSRLGRSGTAWLELTNRLLDTRAAARGELPTLEEVVASIPKEPFDWRKPAGAVATAAAVGAIGFGLWWKLYYDPRLTDEQIRPMRDGLVFLIDEYPAWFKSLSEELAEPTGSPLAAFENDPALSEGVEQLRTGVIERISGSQEVRPGDAGSIFDPGTYWLDDAGRPVRLTPEQLRETISSAPPEDLQVRFGQKELAYVEAAKQAILEIQTLLGDGWVLSASLEETATRFEQRGWNGPANDVRAALRFGDPPRPSGAQVLRVLGLGEAAGQVEQRWEQIDGVDGTEGQPGYPIGPSGPTIAGFDDAVSALIAPVAGMAGGVEFLESNRVVIDEMVWVGSAGLPAVDWAALEADGRETRSDWSGAGMGEYEAWVSAAREYVRLSDDPRQLELWGNFAVQIQGRIDGIREYPAAEQADPIEQRLLDLQSKIRELQRTPVVLKYETELADRSSELTQEVRALADEAETTYARVAVPPREYLAQVNAEQLGLASAQRLWDAQVALAGTAAQLEADRGRDIAFRTVMESLRSTVAWLKAEGFAATPAPATTGGGFDAEAFGLVAETKRDAATERVIAELETLIGRGVRPGLNEPVVASMIDDVRSELVAWGERATVLSEQYLQIASQLDQGALLDAVGPSDAGSITERDRAAQQRAEFGELADAVAGVQDRITGVHELESLGTVTELALGIAVRDVLRSPELLTAAWRRMAMAGGVRIDDATVGLGLGRDLLDDIEVWTADSGSLGRADPRVEFAARARREAPDVWVRLADAAATPQELRAIADARAGFEVDDSRLSPTSRWNVALAGLARSLEAIRDPGDDEASKAVVREFLGASASLGDALTADPGASPGLGGLLNVSRSVTGTEEEKVDYSEVGPARTGGFRFNEDRSELPDSAVGGPPTKLVYDYIRQTRSDSEFSIEFILANPGDTSPVLLSRTEVSMEILRAALRLDDRAEDVLKVFEKPNNGPLVWRVEGGQVMQSGAWLATSVLAREDYPPGLDPGQPRLRHPAQYVAPETALYVAGVLGCRLPTGEEYLEAVLQRYGMTDEPGLIQGIQDGRLSVNLRDQTWADERAWAIAEVARKETLMSFTPELGAFRDDLDPDRSFGGRDGTLWFDIVNGASDGSFEHLLGNVSEWVCDDTESWEREPTALVPLPQEIRQRVQQSGALGVAGGSALSAPSLGVATVKVPEIRELLVKPTGFADVGFRLALVPKGRFVPIAEYVLGFLDEAFVLASEVDG